MATNLPYDLQDLQDRIHVLIDNDPDTPSSDDDEWTTRLRLIHLAVGMWESSDVTWDELWKTYTHASTVAASDVDYTISATDFRTPPGGYVRLILNSLTSYIPVISPEEYQALGGEGKVVWFTGNHKDGWVLNLGWTPVDGDGTVGATIKFDYYKTAFMPESVSDKPEMSDPNFIVYWVAAQKSLSESLNNKFTIYSTMAQECMDRMRITNDLKGNYQSSAIPTGDTGVMGE